MDTNRDTTPEMGKRFLTKLEQLKQEQAHWLNQVELAKTNFHRVSGAIALIESLLAEIDKQTPLVTEEKKD